MKNIPFAALVLGLLGLIPFLWGAGTVLIDGLQGFSRSTFGHRFTAHVGLQNYGLVILCFMSGVIWGYATRAEGRTASLFYGLSVLPALWAFFLGTNIWPPHALIALAIGFALLLVVDGLAQARGLAPPWWMRLRLLLSGVVVPCLLIGVFL